MIRRLWRWIALVPGRRVTIHLINDKVVTGRVRSVGTRSVVMSYSWVWDEFPGRPMINALVRSRADEGTSWCRGWRGRAVDAFLAARALR